jgi:cytoskeletal protein CcmA (bactofilin family)
MTVASGVLTVAGEVDATSLDISGDADIDGTLEADAITIDGVTLSETIADTVGAMVGSNTESGITVAYQDGDNTLDFTVATLNQDTTGTAATVTTAAQPAITSLGTLTTLTVDNVIINGSTIGHTGDTDLMTVASGILTVAGEVSATTLDIGGTNITSTAAELNILDGVTSTAAELNILDGVTASATDINLIDGITNGTAIASKAIITDANIDITGGRNITISGELDAGSLDISGDADIDGTLETDNLTVGGSQGTDGQLLTSTGSGVGWEDAPSSGIGMGKAIAAAIVFG